MTADEVEQLVLTEIGDQWDRWTAHDVDLRRCVVRPPRQETYMAATKEGEVPLRLWLVVEEAPDTHDGYEVFYDDEERIFGLGGVDSAGGRYYIGGYGTLWDTLEGM
jgi:hypothetical protein